jgi:hypothetical protein
MKEIQRNNHGKEKIHTLAGEILRNNLKRSFLVAQELLL